VAAAVKLAMIAALVKRVVLAKNKRNK